MTAKRIIRVANREQFVVVLTKTAQDDTLSWKARGILIYLLSLPDNWQIYVSDLINRAPDKETSVRTGLKELEKAGYLTKQRTRDSKGKITGTEWIIHEKAEVQPYGENPHVEKPHVENPHVENQGLINKNLTKEVSETKNNLTKDTPSLRSGGHREMVQAIENLTLLDMKIRSNAGQIVRLAKELLTAGYTPEHVTQFGELWKTDWRYKKNQAPPSLTVLRQEIGKVKNHKPKPANDLEAFRKLAREQQS
jgi:hypothetical protein